MFHLLLFFTYSRLYWTDKRTLVTSMVTGNRSIILNERLLCPHSITLDHSFYKLYWVDYCAYQIEALNMRTLTHSIALHSQLHLARFISGIAHFHDALYWTEVGSIFFINETSRNRVVKLYTGDSREMLTGIQIVHPSQQPTGWKLLL